MKIYQTNALPALDYEAQACIYNGFDALLTVEIFDKLQPQASRRPEVEATYEFERSLLGPVLTMVRRGILVDATLRHQVVHGIPEAVDPLVRLGLEGRIRTLGGMAKEIRKGKGKWVVVDEDAPLQRMAKAVWGKPINYHSEKQLKEFFYDALAIAPVVVMQKGVRKISCGREAMEKIDKGYVRGIPFAKAILRLRDLEKQRDVLTKGLSPQGRWAASYNIGGTETGRWSSSDNPLGHSASIQNIDPVVRPTFVADPGYVLVNCDLQGAEARAVAYLAGDEEYIEAVESQDCHTLVASLVWGIANTKEASSVEFYRGFTYRELAKRGQHGSNYMAKPPTMARILRIPLKLAEEFQSKYFGRFKRLRAWHQHTATMLQTTGVITTPFGRRRQFWGRLTDDATLREAIAYVPQSMIGDITARGILNIWRTLEPKVQLLANGHDAVLMQVPTQALDEMVPRVLECLKVPVQVTDPQGITRTLVIPSGCEVGFNWGKATKDNPRGMRKYERGMLERLSV